MLLSLLVPYTVTVTVVLLSAALWYYIYFYRPYAKFPAWRLEVLLPLWILNRKKLDIVFLQKTTEQAKKHEREGLMVVSFFYPVVLVFGENIVKTILQAPSATFKPAFIKVFEFTAGKSLFVSDGKQWKKQKKIISPAFYPKALRKYATVMNKYSRALVERLSEKKGETIVDMTQLLSEFTLKLFYESSLGIREVDSKEEERFIGIIQKTIEFCVSRFFNPLLFFDFLLNFNPYARKVLKLDEENRRINIQTLEKIKETVQARDQSQVAKEEESDDLSKKTKSIGEIIIEDRMKLPSFSMEELARELNMLIIAGFDTTSHALMWCFYPLGLHPEIQDRLYDEISTLTDQDIQYSDVQNLTYLDCVLKESLRIYTAPLMGRRLTKDLQCGKYLIPKNTDVIVFASVLHRNPDIYPEPEKFNPDRFMDKNSKIRPWNHIPFMEGVRPCIGKNYAMLSMKIFMIHVLRNFRVVSLDPEENLTFKWSLVLSAEREPRMKFIPRH